MLNSQCVTLIILLLFIQSKIVAQDSTKISREKVFSLSGSMTLGAGLNLSTGLNNPYNRNPYSLNFSPVIKIYKLSLPFTFYITNNSRGVNHPFNRFGVSPTWKWAKFHLGYRSINVSPYIMSGRVFLGGGFELTPKKFRLSFMAGRLAKSQSEDTLATQTIPTTYERFGMGGKIGVGSQRAYFDLLFFKGKDIASSISLPVNSNVTPAENFASGMAFSIPFSKRISWQSSLGLSIYTRDLNAAKYDSTYMSQIPELGFIDLNMSSQLLTAAESSLRYSGDKGGFIIKYRRIDPEYKTMGIFYLQTDLSEYTCIINKSLLKGRMTLNGNFLTSEDNIYKVKNTLTKRMNGGLVMNYRSGKKWSFDLNTLLAHLSQSYVLMDLGDSLKLNQLNKMISTGAHYTIDRSAISDIISLTLGYNGFSNLNPVYLYDFSSSNINCNVSFKTLFKATKMNLTEIVAFYVNEYGTFKTQSFSLGENFGRVWLEDRLNTSLTVNYTHSQISATSQRNAVNCQLGISYKPNKNNIFGLNGSLQNNSSTGSNVWFSSFNVRYTLSFNQLSKAKKI